jgi:hypothetical protein
VPAQLEHPNMPMQAPVRWTKPTIDLDLACAPMDDL